VPSDAESDSAPSSLVRTMRSSVTSTEKKKKKKSIVSVSMLHIHSIFAKIEELCIKLFLIEYGFQT